MSVIHSRQTAFHQYLMVFFNLLSCCLFYVQFIIVAEFVICKSIFIVIKAVRLIYYHPIPS